MNQRRQIPILLLAAIFVIAGAWRVVEAGADDGWAAVCVGCVLLGAWLAVELHDHWDNGRARNEAE